MQRVLPAYQSCDIHVDRYVKLNLIPRKQNSNKMKEGKRSGWKTKC